MRVAKVSFSVALLENMLPLGSKILSVRENEYQNTIEVMIEHSSFEEVGNGELPPSKNLMVHKSSHISKVEYAS